MILALDSVKLRAGRASVTSTHHDPDHLNVGASKMAESESKRCTKCGETKPTAAFDRNCQAKDGRHPNCKACRRARDAANRPAIKEYRRVYHEKNRDREAAYMAEWRKRNIERKRASDRARAKTHAPQARARAMAWNLTHPRETRERIRRWQANNPTKLAAWGWMRRARLKGASGRGIRSADWKSLVADSLGLCPYCNISGAKLTLDHIEPLARGGAHDIDNAAAACDACNRSKNDLPLIVWMARRRVA